MDWWGVRGNCCSSDGSQLQDIVTCLSSFFNLFPHWIPNSVITIVFFGNSDLSTFTGKTYVLPATPREHSLGS